MDSRYLAIYLNDHLAGTVVGVELVRRARSSNEGTRLGDTLAEIGAEVEADQDTLRELMRRLGVSESRIKPAGAWLGEKLGRLKLNGRLRGYSDLSRVVELEGLCIGVTGKRLLWEALEHNVGGELPEFDFGALAARASAQFERLDAERVAAAATAFQRA